ncbi:DUF4179 domain-containing protein [Paenibacillus sp. Leaf72]|uniref:DUF4179 domain-containing protein n=1 Tax=Paenibacillus sp. Leaf72 TaxID=1736234 RepID=UPI0007001CAB|nr:DUF4179 domain-containing protein [Paenibacillus sp. Leaf72]KQO04601.1 hypothetical protein ASF12_13800 [Paenibacillus sp. Leaf72]
MKPSENEMIQRLKEVKPPAYPDFEAMWQRIEQAGVEGAIGSKGAALTEGSQLNGAGLQQGKSSAAASGHESVRVLRKPRSLKRGLFIAAAVALVAATPVFAYQMDWIQLLNGRSGIQSALAQGMGQNIEKSAVQDDATFTIHTAVVDDNRTVLLYSLVPPDGEDGYLSFTNMHLTDSNGKTIDGNYSMRGWDEASQSYRGYFETEWTPEQLVDKVDFTASEASFISNASLPIELDLASDGIQVFNLDKDGMGKLEVQLFKQNGDEVLLSSALSFTDKTVSGYAYPELTVKSGDTPIKTSRSGTFGKPGPNGEYTMQQYFKQSELKSGNITYSLSYAREENRIEGEWNLPLQLDKQAMLAGTIKRDVHLPIDLPQGSFNIDQVVITPTQIRLATSHEQKYMQYSFKNYELDVGGTILEGHFWGSDDPYTNSIRFERPQGLTVTEQTPITLIQSYEVTEHTDKDAVIHLSSITEEKQHMTTEVGGYEVKWTYYRKGADVFVQNESDDKTFGGVNQTYRLEGKKSFPSEILTANFSGDGINSSTEVFRNYDGDNLDLHMYYYTTDAPDKELRTSILPQ